ncbi:hypothetical protein, partial [Tessaracoccus lubricantis]
MSRTNQPDPYSEGINPDPHRQENEACVRAVCAASLEEIRRYQRGVIQSSDHQIQPINREDARRFARFAPTVANDPRAFTPYELSEDPVGDPAIPLDLECSRAMAKAADYHRAAYFAEDDELRRIYGTNAPAVRAEGISKALARKIRLLITDPLDGSHQMAGFNQPGAYGPAAMTVSPSGSIAVAVA